MSSEKCVIRVYGDSYSMPRAFIGVPFDRTYSELILAKINAGKGDPAKVYLYNRSQGGADIAQLYQLYLMDSSYFGKRPEDILIIQSGIVDCAPRPVPFWLRNQISKLPGKIRAPIVSILHNKRPILLKAGLSWKRTTERKFSSIFRQWLTHAASDFKRVYVFNIVPVSDGVEAHSPRFKESIRRYNRLIGDAALSVRSRSVRLIDVFTVISETSQGMQKYMSEDGYHLSAEGHRLFGELVLKDGLFDEEASAL